MQSTYASVLSRIQKSNSQLPFWQIELIAQIMRSISESYVFLEKIDNDKLATELTLRFNSLFGAYDRFEAIEDKEQFARALAKMLQEVTGDSHFDVHYDPAIIARYQVALEQTGSFPFYKTREEFTESYLPWRLSLSFVCSKIIS